MLDIINKISKTNSKAANLGSQYNDILCFFREEENGFDINKAFSLLLQELKKINIEATIFILEPDGNSLFIKQSNLSPRLNKLKINLKDHKTFLKAKEKKEPVFLSQNSIAKNILKEKGKNNSIITPLFIKKELMGFIEFSSPLFTEDETEKNLTQNFSDRFIFIITNSLLFSEFKERDKKYRDLFENAHKGFFILNGKLGKFVAVNNSLCEITGYYKKELLEMNYIRIFATAEQEKIKGYVKERLKGNSGSKNAPLSYETIIITKNKEPKDVRIVVTGIINKEEWFVAVEDITEQKQIKADLSLSEIKLQFLFDNINNGVIFFQTTDNGKTFTIKRLNKAAEKIEQIKAGDVIDKKASDIFPEIKSFGLFEIMQRVWKTGNAEKYPISFYQDERISGWRENYVYKLPSGEIVTVFTDETDRITASQRLANNEKKFRHLSESISDGVILVVDGKISWANKAFCQIMGYKEKEVLEKNVLDLVAPDDISMVRDRLKKRVEGKRVPKQYHTRALKKDGSEIIIEISPRATVVDDKKAIQVVVRDVTAKKKAEEELKKSEKKYRTLFETAVEGILIAEAESKKFLYANPAICKMLGYSEKELKKMSVPDIHPRYHTESALEEFNKQLKLKKDNSHNIPCQKKDKKIIYVDITSTITEIDGIKCNVGFFTDITERRKMEEELKESEQKYRSLFDNAVDIVVMMDLKGYITFANEAFLNISGYKKNDLGKIHISQITHPDEYNRMAKLIKKRVEGKLVVGKYEFKFVTKDGEIKEVEYTSSPIIRDSKAIGVQAIARDLTNRKKAEEEIRKLSEFNQRILDNAPVSIMTLDKKGKILSVNKFFYEIAGSQKREGKILFDLPFFKKEGLVDLYKNLLKTGKTFTKDNCYTVNTKGEDKYLSITAIPLKNKGGEIEGAISMARDNTEAYLYKQKLENLNKDLENKIAERTKQLNETNKELNRFLNLKTQFTADAAHELRTPLTIIQGNLDLITTQTKNDKDNPCLENIDFIKKEVQNISNLLSDLSVIANIEANPENEIYEKIDMTSLIKTICESLKVVAKQKNIKIDFKDKKGNYLISGDETKIERLLLNILRNAIKYNKKNGWIKISLEKNLKNIKIIIEDDGIGISKEDIPHIFDRFYRADKSRSRAEGGTGLGLSIAKWIAEAHKGSIKAKSTLGKGSTFTITLPIN